MSLQEAKRQQIADLLLAGVAPGRITTTVGASVSTIYTVKGRISNGEGILRKQGSGGVIKKRDHAFLKTLGSWSHGSWSCGLRWKKMPLCFFKPGEKVDTEVCYN